MADDNRVTMDGFLLRQSAKVLNRHEGELDGVRIGLAGLMLRLDPDDPVRAHPHFLAAFDRFREAWVSEIGLASEAAGHIGVRLAATADGMEQADRMNRDAAQRLRDGTGGGAAPR